MRPLLFVFVAAAVLAPSLSAESVRSLVRKGNEAFGKGNYQEALAMYEAAAKQEPESAAIWFNKGDALYRQGRFREAAEAYERAAILSDDARMQARSKFNQGNAGFRQGLQEAAADPGQALGALEQSIRHWRDALRSDPGLDDARHNIEVARLFIKRLRKQMQNQPRQGEGKRGGQRRNDQQQAGADEKKDRQQGDSAPEKNPLERAESRPQQAGEQRQRARAAEKPEDILNEERENRRRRVRAMIRIQPVDKDW